MFSSHNNIRYVFAASHVRGYSYTLALVLHARLSYPKGRKSLAREPLVNVTNCISHIFFLLSCIMQCYDVMAQGLCPYSPCKYIIVSCSDLDPMATKVYTYTVLNRPNKNRLCPCNTM